MDGFSNLAAGLGVILLFTCFVKLLATLSILRFGIGLEGASFGVVTLALSLVLSMVVMQPQLEQVGGLGVIWGHGSVAGDQKIHEVFQPFLKKHADPLVVQKISGIAHKLNPSKEVQADGAIGDFPALAAAFLLTELREAFKLGFLFILPFLVIDLIVVNLLMCLGVQQLSPAMIALPVKLLLFLAADGWTLVSEKLLGGYL